MINTEKYLRELNGKLRACFGERLLYVGLQGSYLRGEATEDSDIDIMAVVDGLSAADLEAYRNAVLSMGDYERSCGFICGKQELAAWNRMEIFHLLHTTKDCCGSLKMLVPSYTRRDAADYVKLSAGNLYHALCHRYIHTEKENSMTKLPLCRKEVFFLLQDLCGLEQGRFPQTRKELSEMLTENDRRIWEMLQMPCTNGEELCVVLDAMLCWCGDVMRRADRCAAA